MTSDRIQVTAAIIVHDGKVLLARRRSGHLTGKWEFPGGKTRPGEAPEHGLQREIEEELGAGVEVGRFLARSDHDYPHIRIRLDAYLCEWTANEFCCGEDHDEIAWARPADLLGFELSPADIPLAEAAIAALGAERGR